MLENKYLIKKCNQIKNPENVIDSMGLTNRKKLKKSKLNQKNNQKFKKNVIKLKKKKTLKTG